MTSDYTSAQTVPSRPGSRPRPRPRTGTNWPKSAGHACPDTIPESWPTPEDSPSGTTGSPMPGRGGHTCGLFAVDIADFTDPRRDEHVQLYLREMMYRILERAFDGSGVPWHACQHEDRGDGALVIVPPVIPVDGLADPLPERLCGLVRVHNRLSSQDARIQLRAAAHVGRVYRDDHGVTGDAASHLYRLLDAPRLKHLLAASGSELAFITSDYFYDTVIRRHPTLVDPAAFESVTVDIKHTTATGWAQLLGSASSTARVLPFDRSA
jgi:hypothetical protein